MIVCKLLRELLETACSAFERGETCQIDVTGMRAYVNHIRMLSNLHGFADEWYASPWAAKGRTFARMCDDGHLEVSFDFENEELAWVWRNAKRLRLGNREYTILRRFHFMTFAGVQTAGSGAATIAAPIWRVHGGGLHAPDSFSFVQWHVQSGIAPAIVALGDTSHLARRVTAPGRDVAQHA